MEYPVRVLKYCLVFAAVYAGLLALLNVLPIEAGSGANMGILVVAIAAAVTMFAHENERAPNKTERRRMVWVCFIFSILVSAAASYFLLSMQGQNPMEVLNLLIDKLSPILFGVFTIIALLIYYILMGICFCLLGTVAAKKHS